MPPPNTRFFLQSIYVVALLTTIRLIASHILKNAFITNAASHSSVAQFIDFFATSANRTATHTNQTIPQNITETWPEELGARDPDFYTWTLWRELLLLLMLAPADHVWHLWLERLFPARGAIRGVTAAASGDRQGKDLVGEVEGDDSREEEVVKRWISQGKIKRASLSWWNTFVKWVLHMTVHTALSTTLWRAMDNVVARRGAMYTLKQLKPDFIWSLPLSFVRPVEYISTLIMFVIIPVYRRVQFTAAVDLIYNVFWWLVVSYVVPWVLSTQGAQYFLDTMRESMENQTKITDKGRLIGAPDEL